MIDLNPPKRVDKPWGYELLLAHTDRYVGKILHIDRGQRLSRQYHRVKDETLYVLSGRLILEVGPAEAVERVEVPAGLCYRTLPGTIHRYIAPDDQDCDLVETSTPELDDVVRLEDVYGREGTSNP
jgi:mannose-6-phosphate isomerase